MLRHFNIILKMMYIRGHVDDNFERKKFVPKPELTPQITSSPYWRINQSGD